MTISKYRAAILVFLVGFGLGLSVFVASRLFVRSVLSSDAITAAQTLAEDIAAGIDAQSSGGLSAIRSYVFVDMTGNVIDSRGAEPGGASPSSLDQTELARLSGVARPVVDESSFVASLLGLSEAAIKRVAVPVVRDGTLIGTLIAVVDQSQALDSLTRAFSIVGMVTVGLAVLAVIAVAFVVTRGHGFGGRAKAFDPSSLPRDALTDVPTRSGLNAVLDDAVSRAAGESQVGLMIIGLDGFRAVNNLWGHAAGDEVLRLTAERLRPFASGAAGVARIAGDEFAIVVEGEEAVSIRQLADRIRAALGEPYLVEGGTVLLGASIGSAIYPVNAENGALLFRAADTALSRAKAQGRNGFAAFDTAMKDEMRRNAELERDLRQAIAREELVVFYQPQLELASGRLRGYEALLRWERPGDGIVAPRDFLPVAEETGLIHAIGEWVLRRACTDGASWLDSGTVAVNFSAVQLAAPLDRTIAGILAETGLPPERLEIEVPEEVFLDGSAETLATLARIKALGVRVAMDDFGARYSGLVSLARFPFDKVKIDRSFVSQLTSDADAAAIVAAIVALGRTMSIDVTAEGVETSEQVTMLKAAGCSIVQGFLFGAPKREALQRPEVSPAIAARGAA